jgi:hypothetical protein
MVTQKISRDSSKTKHKRAQRRSRKARSAARQAQVAPVETATETTEASSRRADPQNQLYDAQALINSVLSGLHAGPEGDGRWRLTLQDGEVEDMRRTLHMAVQLIDTAQEELEADQLRAG